MRAKSGVSLSLLLVQLLPLLLLLLLLPLVWLTWPSPKSEAPSFETKQRAPRESIKITDEQSRLLARWMSVTGGGGMNSFATKLNGPPTSCAAAAFCQRDRGDKWRVRALLAKFNVSNYDDEYSLVEMKEAHYDIAVTSSIKVVRRRSDGSPATWPTAYYMGDRNRAAYMTSRIWPLGLQRCERVNTNEFQLDGEFQSAWETPLHALSNPGQFTEVRHHDYNLQWQLWMRSEVGGLLTEALAVRVLNEATRDCSVERRWQLTRSEDGQRLQAVMEEFRNHATVSSKDEVFRLPTGCYRVDL